MAITTDNKKLSVLEMGQAWESGLPLSPDPSAPSDSIDQKDQQQLLHGFTGVEWKATDSHMLDASGVVNHYTIGTGDVLSPNPMLQSINAKTSIGAGRLEVKSSLSLKGIIRHFGKGNLIPKGPVGHK